MPKLELGLIHKAEIEGVDDPKYGFGYLVHSIYQDVPKTVETQKDYLKAILTELQVGEIYKVYPDADVIELIKNDDFEYKKVKGIGETTYQRIRQKIIENLEFQDLFSQLGRYGITYDTIKKLIDEFGSSTIAIQKIKENPYVLIRINGISFKKADVIARNMGISLDDPHRILSGIKHAIGEEQSKGHTYIVLKELLKNSFELLQIDTELIHNQLNSSLSAENPEIIAKGENIALNGTYLTEQSIARKMKGWLKNSEKLDFNVEKFIQSMEEKYKIALSEQQKEFFYNIKNYSVNLLVGFAGCGKSMLQKLLIDLLEQLGYTYKLLAPTGKAAKVLSGYADRKAMTIHKAIGYGQDKKEKDIIEITEDFVIIDEVSMLDVFIASMTFNKMMNPQVRVLLVGDAFQIPSVQCGNLLHDMLSSGEIPTTKLDIVFRQSEGGILDIATKIRKGQKFVDDDFTGMTKFGKNLTFHSVEQKWMPSGYKHYYQEFLKKYRPEDILILTPMKKGELGTFAVNKTIQEIVNPQNDNKKELVYTDDCTFRIDDYIINTKNTYEIMNTGNELAEIVNGDTGVIVDIVTDWKKDKNNDDIQIDMNGIIVDFDFDTIRIPLDDIKQLLHSWCITKHKSQGSSAKVVIVILDKSHKFQANANLLYTAITRAVDEAVILCQAETVNFAMRKVENLKRHTFLMGMLKTE
ncbi:hypothetical protein BC351_00455 [Paenibacillus ferrarius]|uniref:Uncharacterized protein n=1 Tax=Paenibacillus ferrarius TaxID=1469647 RepID=A0A1V4HS79_9BACL|nr:AAA family ATPase [Paenibacillus ferrarius]OPH61747.1 hypothetical protein BC351_00455 [Paenibacillus ferrarius]